MTIAGAVALLLVIIARCEYHYRTNPIVAPAARVIGVIAVALSGWALVLATKV